MLEQKVHDTRTAIQNGTVCVEAGLSSFDKNIGQIRSLLGDQFEEWLNTLHGIASDGGNAARMLDASLSILSSNPARGASEGFKEWYRRGCTDIMQRASPHQTWRYWEASSTVGEALKDDIKRFSEWPQLAYELALGGNGTRFTAYADGLRALQSRFKPFIPLYHDACKESKAVTFLSEASSQGASSSGDFSVALPLTFKLAGMDSKTASSFWSHAAKELASYGPHEFGDTLTLFETAARYHVPSVNSLWKLIQKGLINEDVLELENIIADIGQKDGEMASIVLGKINEKINIDKSHFKDAVLHVKKTMVYQLAGKIPPVFDKYTNSEPLYSDLIQSFGDKRGSALVICFERGIEYGALFCAAGFETVSAFDSRFPDQRNPERYQEFKRKDQLHWDLVDLNGGSISGAFQPTVILIHSEFRATGEEESQGLVGLFEAVSRKKIASSDELGPRVKKIQGERKEAIKTLMSLFDRLCERETIVYMEASRDQTLGLETRYDFQKISTGFNSERDLYKLYERK